MIALPAGNLTPMVGAYVTEQTGMELQAGMYSAFMIVNDQQDFVAGVVLTNFRKTDIEISCASETPQAWKPTVCKAIFTYVFEQLGCVRCTSITVKGNKRARTFLEGLGFQLEGNVRLGYDGRRDALIYGLLRSECRFLADEEHADGEEIGTSGPGSTGPVRDGPSTDRGEPGRGDDAGEPEPDQPVHAGREFDVLH
jgi:hypothetical protein